MKSLVFLLALSAAHAQPAAEPFQLTELLGRPTARSVTVHFVPSEALEAYVEFGTEPGVYGAATAPLRAEALKPVEVLLDGLEPGSRYFYRLRYRARPEEEFAARPERSFHTQRPPGSTFTFTIQADPHLDDNTDPETYKITLANQAAAGADFMIDLGDTMMSDKLGRNPTDQQVLDRHLLLRSYYALACHSLPLYLVLGNHEGEWLSFADGTESSLPVRATRLRKLYFPNPLPNDFYTGNEKDEPLVGLRQNYYAWHWGDALFVVIDPYWNLPQGPEQRGDWALTLGREQYDWLKRTLESSTAKFKFVFGHNLVGGVDRDGKMRGGVEAAKYLEWGGYNLDGSWGFFDARPGWDLPIHELLVRTGVTAFFHGHDHIYAHQSLDGVVYQEVPQPGARNYPLGNRATTYGYLEGTLLGGAGYLRITVSPEEVRSDYVMTWLPTLENDQRRNGEIAHTFTVPAPPVPERQQ